MDIVTLCKQDFYEELVQSLPMEDTLFLAKLNKYGLFPGDLKAKVQAQQTQAEAADLFITKTAASGNANSFWKLLSAMKEFDSPPLKNLAEDIENKAQGR